MEVSIDSDATVLAGHLARPSVSTGPGTSARLGLVICPTFPWGPKGARTAGHSYPELADRVAVDPGWVALTFTFRGTGESQGEFSPLGWLADVRAAVEYLRVEERVDGVWLAGFGTGGSLSLCAAGADEGVRGVAALGAQSDLQEWAGEPRRFLDHVRSVEAISSPSYPKDFEAWARELREVRPLELIGKIPPRPILLVHGSEDDVVPPLDARALSEAAGGGVELRLVVGGGHRLRHDPRAIAILLGWLGRQRT